MNCRMNSEIMLRKLKLLSSIIILFSGMILGYITHYRIKVNTACINKLYLQLELHKPSMIFQTKIDEGCTVGKKKEVELV